MRKKINTRSDILLFKRRSFKRIRFKKFKKKLFHKFFRIYSCGPFLESWISYSILTAPVTVLATFHPYIGYTSSLQYSISWLHLIPILATSHPCHGHIPFLNPIPLLASSHSYLGFTPSL